MANTAIGIGGWMVGRFTQGTGGCSILPVVAGGTVGGYTCMIEYDIRKAIIGMAEMTILRRWYMPATLEHIVADREIILVVATFAATNHFDMDCAQENGILKSGWARIRMTLATFGLGRDMFILLTQCYDAVVATGAGTRRIEMIKGRAGKAVILADHMTVGTVSIGR